MELAVLTTPATSCLQVKPLNLPLTVNNDPAKSIVEKNRMLVEANLVLQESNRLLVVAHHKAIVQAMQREAKLSVSIQHEKNNLRKLRVAAEQADKHTQLLVATLNVKDAEIANLTKELLTFTHIFNHNLQEPLRRIQVTASMVLEKEKEILPGQLKEHLHKMQRSAHHMRELIKDLLAYAEMSWPYRKLECTDLNTTLERAQHELKERILNSEATITATGLTSLNVVPDQFGKLFKAILDNSIKFAQPGIKPAISITCKIQNGSELPLLPLSPEKKYCHISFSDKGIGFEPQFKQRIFEVFQKLNGKTYSGTGIGLSICKKIVENHNGLITANSAVNMGSVIDVYIPLLNKQAVHKNKQ